MSALNLTVNVYCLYCALKIAFTCQNHTKTVLIDFC